MAEKHRKLLDTLKPPSTHAALHRTTCSHVYTFLSMSSTVRLSAESRSSTWELETFGRMLQPCTLSATDQTRTQSPKICREQEECRGQQGQTGSDGVRRSAPGTSHVKLRSPWNFSQRSRREGDNTLRQVWTEMLSVQ